MKEFRIIFSTAKDGNFRAQLADADGNSLGVEVPLIPFLTEDDYENLRWYLEEYMDLPDGGAVVRAQSIERDLERWGRKLYDAFFAAEVNRELLKRLLAGPEPRELTIATLDQALLRLPWELMADEAGSLAQRVSVRRQLEKPDKIESRTVKLPLRILYIVSRPSDTDFIDPRLTTKALFDALDPLVPSVRVDFCRPGETNLPAALRYELHGLARADSLWLLSHILKRDGVTLSDPRLSRDRLDPLLNDLSDHPLSLELVGPHLRSLTPETIRAEFGKLLETFQQDAPEERNRSLLASLEFSRRHLSPAAREALPWLGLFRGGVLEAVLLEMSQLAPEAWEPIRRELQGLALVRTEDDIPIGGLPYLRFHPTLAYTAADGSLADKPEIRERFINVYLTFRQALNKALGGSQSRAALELLNREEANYRTAVRWAVADHQFHAAAVLGGTFSHYLQMSGRLRELDAWVQ